METPMQAQAQTSERIGVIGLGYVGLPLLLAFAKKLPHTFGYDINEKRIQALKNGIDVTNEGLEAEITASSTIFTHRIEDLKDCTIFIVAVPTPVDQYNNPDLTLVMKACGTVGTILKKGDLVIFESTVYPGVTEEICCRILESVSDLKLGDFSLGYSPERMNPGDKHHTVENVIKVVSGNDAAAQDRVASLYELIVKAGVHRAPSIKVAEAAKVIENTQRDLNIALMNELAIIFDRLGIATSDVLEAAGTKWNFLKFTPGLVGGHCIGVDPYYLTTLAQQIGYHPQVILAGRRINDGMGTFIGQRLIKLLIQENRLIKGAKVGILGLTFKENVSDIRNSRVPDILKELKEFGVTPMVHDPLADKHLALEEYGVVLQQWEELVDLDAAIIAVGHHHYAKMAPATLLGILKTDGILVDIKSVLKKSDLPKSITYWSL